MKKLDHRALQNLELQNHQTSEAKQKSILALDYGEKFCGFAFSPDGVCVFPLEIIPTQSFQERIFDLLNKKYVHVLIVGLPLQNDNSENETCQLIRAEIKKLNLEIPVVFVNERSSSESVHAPEKNERHDDLAAAKILEFYLAQK